MTNGISWFEYDFDKVFEAGRNAHGSEEQSTPLERAEKQKVEANQVVSGISVGA